MSSVEKISVALTPQQALSLRDAVASGEYASTSEIVREALRTWQEKRDLRQLEISTLQTLWAEGRGSGPAERKDFRTLREEARTRLSSMSPDGN